jgi:hypothetical protein
VAFGGGGAGTVVADDAALVLHHGERGRKVSWEPRKARRGAASGSPSGWTTATIEESGWVPSLSITVGGQEAMREGQWRREHDTQAWMRGRGEKGGTVAADTFYGDPVARAERKKGRMSGVWHRMEGKNGSGVQRREPAWRGCSGSGLL